MANNQLKIDTTLFEHTPINPDLVNSIDQVYLLRQTLTEFFCDQREKSLTFSDEVERARSIVALVDVLWRSKIPVKVLILSELSKTLEQIEKSFQLHTNLPLNSLSELSLKEEKNIYLIRYQKINKTFNPSQSEEYFNNFHLIITDDLENEKYEMTRRRLKYHQAWLLNTKVTQPQAVML